MWGWIIDHIFILQPITLACADVPASWIITLFIVSNYRLPVSGDIWAAIRLQFPCENCWDSIQVSRTSKLKFTINLDVTSVLWTCLLAEGHSWLYTLPLKNLECYKMGISIQRELDFFPPLSTQAAHGEINHNLLQDIINCIKWNMLCCKCLREHRRGFEVVLEQEVSNISFTLASTPVGRPMCFLLMCLLYWCLMGSCWEYCMAHEPSRIRLVFDLLQPWPAPDF